MLWHHLHSQNAAKSHTLASVKACTHVVALSAEHRAQADSNHSDDEADDEEARRADLRLLAHTLVGFAAQQDLRLDTFAMGPASRALGQPPLNPPAPPPPSLPRTPTPTPLVAMLDLCLPKFRQQLAPYFAANMLQRLGSMSGCCGPLASPKTVDPAA